MPQGVVTLSIEIVFGKQLRKIREERKLSQEELAFLAKLDGNQGF